MGTQLSPRKGAQQPSASRLMSIVTKRSPISATAELLFFYIILLSSVTSIIPPAGVRPMKVFEIEFGLLKVVISWPDCKPERPLFSAEFVCLSVCLTGTSTLQR